MKFSRVNSLVAIICIAGFLSASVSTQAQAYRQQKDQDGRGFKSYHIRLEADRKADLLREQEQILKTKQEHEKFIMEMQKQENAFKQRQQNPLQSQTFDRKQPLNPVNQHKANKQCLDSVVVNENSRDVFTYDVKGNNTSFIRQNWDSYAYQWKDNARTTYTHDANNNLTGMVDKSHNGTGWVNQDSAKYAYDSYGNETLSEQYYWNKNKWEGSNKREASYDAAGRETMRADYHWNNNRWQGGQKYEYDFDANGHRIMFARYNWNSMTNKWEGDRKDSTLSDNENSYISIVFGWDNTLEKWIEDYKVEVTYTIDLSAMTYTAAAIAYIRSNGAWVPGYKEEEVYKLKTATPGGDIEEAIDYQESETGYEWTGGAWKIVSEHKILTMDSNGKPSVTQYSERNAANVLAAVSQERITYNAAGDEILVIVVEWDESTNDWVNSSKDTFAYDANGERILTIYYTWNGSDWVGTDKYVSACDAAGHKILSESYEWDAGNNSWKGRYKDVSAYDAAENQILRAEYNWDDIANDWTLRYKDSSQYDVNRIIIMSIQLHYEEWSMEWHRYKHEYAYDAADNQIMSASYNWDDITSKWVGNYKNTSAYNAAGLQTMRTYYDWDDNTNSWTGTSKWEYAYTSSGNLTSTITYLWNNGWKESAKTELDYDMSYSRTDLVIPYAYSDMQNKRTQNREYYWNDNSWDLDRTTLFYWNEKNIISPSTYTVSGRVKLSNGTGLANVTITFRGTQTTLTNANGEYTITVDSNASVIITPSLSGYSFTPASITCNNVVSNLTGKDFTADNGNGIAEAQGVASVQIYPNPTSGQLRITNYNISMGEIGIYDIAGRAVETRHVTSLQDEIVIDISHLTNGLYFLKTGNRTVKIVKQ
jgi:hypothetical protein